MMFPILSVDEAAEYECPDAMVDAFVPSPWMSCRDQWARAMGHADDWESDEMGAAASIYRLDWTDRLGLAWCDAADRRSTMGPRSTTYRPGPLGPVADGPWAYVRSDDSGFWDLRTGTEDECREWLAWWVAANVPTYCGCGEPLERETVMTRDGYADQYPDDGLCDACQVAQDETDAANLADASGSCEMCGAETDANDGSGFRCSSHGPRGGLGDELRDAERYGR